MVRELHRCIGPSAVAKNRHFTRDADYLSNRLFARVPLDKSEGVVKQKFSLAMPEHRDVCRFTTSKSHCESIRFESTGVEN